jgi:hypothetical protein
VLTLSQHQAMATPYREIRNRWVTLLCECSRMFPHQTPLNRRIEKAYRLFDQLKSELDNEYCLITPATSPLIYYGPKQAPGKPLSEYLDEDITHQKNRLIEITRPILSGYGPTVHVRKLLRDLLTTLTEVEQLIRERPHLKRRVSTGMPLPKPWRDELASSSQKIFRATK